MQITLSPIFSEYPAPAVHITGDVLTIDGEEFDFSQLPEGATLPAAAIDSDWFAGPVERIDGELHLTLKFPHGFEASQKLRFPELITMVGDGPIPFPTDPEPEDAPQ